MFRRRELFGDLPEAFMHESVVEVRPDLARECIQGTRIIDQSEVNVPRILLLEAVVDRGDADDHTAMVIDLELRSNMRILQLTKLGILNNNERILAVNVLDLALKELRTAEESGIVQANHGGCLVGAIGQL